LGNYILDKSDGGLYFGIKELAAMTDVTSNPIYTDDDAARAFLEELRWPEGVICIHCGGFGDAIAPVENTGKRTKPPVAGKRYRPAREGLYYCNDCKGQFSVTVGTVMEDSHIPLHKWVYAFHLLCSSKKGCSSHQLQRSLKISYKSAWYLSHRIREAMRSGFLAPPMGGNPSKFVEADETFLGRKEGTKKAKGGYHHKMAAMTLIDRSTGEARSFHIDAVDGKTILPIVRANVAKESSRKTPTPLSGGI
jgi:transposase-like protein